MNKIRYPSILIFLTSLAQAQFVKVGTCQPAIDWGFPAIHSLSSAHGKIYLGYGDWNAHPGPVILTSYDPATGVMTAEHSLNTDSIGAMREIDGKLYIPSIDPIHYQHFEDFTIIHPDGHIERRTPAGFYHLYDIFKSSEDHLIIMGSQEPNEVDVSNGTIYRSLNGGTSWDNFHPSLQPEPLPQVTTPFRYYWGFEDPRGIHFENTLFDTNWQEGSHSYGAVDHLHQHGSLNNQLTFMVVEKPPAASGWNGELIKIDASGGSQTIDLAVKDYALFENTLYILNSLGTSISLTDVFQSQTQNPFEWTPPVAFESLHILDGILYGGAFDGDLYAVRLDNESIATHSNGFQNILPERAGEEIDIDENRMVISAPRSARPINGETILNAGKVLLFERESPRATWELIEEFFLPDEDLSPFGNWFGSHLDLNDDQLLIAAGGNGSTSRGKEATIHAISKNQNEWQWGESIPHPFTHDVALVNDLVYTSPLVIVRYNSLEFDGIIGHNPAGSPYRPYGIFTYDPNDQSRVFFGQTGDLSRGGGLGIVTIYDTAANLAPIQTLQSDKPDRFGFSLEAKNGLLAVGAPFEDTQALQAGSVHLYRRDINGNYAEEATIFASDADTEANFGHAVALTDRGVLYVSAPSANGPNGRRGAVYAFRNNNGTWEELAKFTPEAGETKTWEFGMTLEADRNQVVVASAQVDESLPYLERMTTLPRATSSFSDWAKYQGLSDNDISPLASFAGSAITQLEAYALESHAGEAPHFQVDESGHYFYYLRRTDAAERGLTYRAEVADDLENWTIVNTEVIEPMSPGWERVKTTTTGNHSQGRVIVNLAE